jgi:ATP-dependent Clp protease ATP-binding subunit ClpC
MDELQFTGDALRLLADARGESDRLRHEYVGTEHLVLALTRQAEGGASAVLGRLGVDRDRVRESIAATIGTGRSEHAPGAELPFTSRTRTALALATESARELGQASVGAEHVLLGLMREGLNIGAQILHEHGLTVDGLRRELARA